MTHSNCENVLDAQTASNPHRDAAIRQAQTQVIARMKKDLSAARSTLSTRGRVTEGLSCTVEQGKFRTVMDLGKGMGGDAAGPSPGFFARGAIAGCVAIAVKMNAARLGYVFDAVEVEVTTDFDDAALFGLGSACAAPLETRIDVHVETDEAPARVEALVAQVLEMDPWFLALRDAQSVVPQVIVHGPSADAEGQQSS